MFFQSNDSATCHSISSSISTLWASVSFMNLWPVLTQLQQFHSKQALGKIEKGDPCEETHMYEWVCQQNTCEEVSQLKGKAKISPWAQPLSGWSIITLLVGSAFCSAAKSLTWLCIAQGIQGIGGGGAIQVQPSTQWPPYQLTVGWVA